MHGLYINDVWHSRQLIQQPFATCFQMLRQFESIKGIGIVYEPHGLHYQVNIIRHKGLVYWNVFINRKLFIDYQSLYDMNGFEDFFKLTKPVSSFVNLKDGREFYITLKLT